MVHTSIVITQSFLKDLVNHLMPSGFVVLPICLGFKMGAHDLSFLMFETVLRAWVSRKDVLQDFNHHLRYCTPVA